MIASVLFVRAKALGRKLLVGSNSALMLSIDEPNRLNANTGTRVVRVLVLVSSYPLVLCIQAAPARALEEAQDAAGVNGPGGAGQRHR